MVNLLLAEKPVNQIPAEYREYDSFEISDATVKNGFTLSAKNVHLSLVQNENERIDILFAYEKTSRSMHEKRSGTLPLGPSSEVACEWIESP
ncbi:MAG: hypothetical protein JST04_15815 [Bdellovibrionales bacterium]|nr:hypothetical protein [Bdellovibrionales bacterium]